MDKVQKIREEVERIINRRLNLINGDYFDLNEETDGLTNEIMDIIDPLQEEPVSGLDNGNMPVERWKQAVEAASNQRSYRSSKGLTETRDDYFVDGVQWADEHPKEPISKEWIEELRTKLDSMSKEDFKKIFDKYMEVSK